VRIVFLTADMTTSFGTGGPFNANASSGFGVGGSFGSAGTSGVINSTTLNPNNDFLVSDPPNDTISSLRFSPAALLPRNFVVATTWDNEVRLWEVHPNGATQGVGLIRHEAPVLASTWNSDGTRIFSAGCDRVCRMWDPATNAIDTVAYHDAPIRHCAFVGEQSGVAGAPFLMTAGWDRALKYWDIRTPPNPAQSGGGAMGSVALSERCYAMDVNGSLAVIGTADREVLWFDLRQPLQPAGRKTSPLRYQTRCISIFADRTCFAISSVEGRCGIEYLQDTSKSFAFKCHRIDQGAGGQERITPVNCVTAFPSTASDLVDVLATAGGDGRVNIWNKAAKVKTKGLKEVPLPIVALEFNANGSILAYAMGYDWSQGASGYARFQSIPPAQRNTIFLHAVQDDEIRSKSGNTRPPARKGLF
jgi:mRNA export factor